MKFSSGVDFADFTFFTGVELFAIEDVGAFERGTPFIASHRVVERQASGRDDPVEVLKATFVLAVDGGIQHILKLPDRDAVTEWVWAFRERLETAEYA